MRQYDSRYLMQTALGRPPIKHAISSPLISLLESLPPMILTEIKGVRLSPSLGYNSGAQFNNAAQLLKWLKPKSYLLGSETTPSESRRIKFFNKKLELEDLQKHSASWPSKELLSYYGVA